MAKGGVTTEAAASKQPNTADTARTTDDRTRCLPRQPPSNHVRTRQEAQQVEREEGRSNCPWEARPDGGARHHPQPCPHAHLALAEERQGGAGERVRASCEARSTGRLLKRTDNPMPQACTSGLLRAAKPNASRKPPNQSPGPLTK